MQRRSLRFAESASSERVRFGMRMSSITVVAIYMPCETVTLQFHVNYSHKPPSKISNKD